MDNILVGKKTKKIVQSLLKWIHIGRIVLALIMGVPVLRTSFYFMTHTELLQWYTVDRVISITISLFLVTHFSLQIHNQKDNWKKLRLGARQIFAQIFRNPKWPTPPSWIFWKINKIMSDTSFPIDFGLKKTMQVLFQWYELNLTL